MNIFIAFTEKEELKIAEWKKALPKCKGRRMFSISFVATGERNGDSRLLFRSIFKSSDGHKLLVSKKAIMH